MEFKTQNADFAAFLILEGIPFLRCEINPVSSKAVLIVFDNAKQNCLDLERVFLSSEAKRYRDVHKWLLQRIHETLRQNSS